jgi:hypothetical protein
MGNRHWEPAKGDYVLLKYNDKKAVVTLVNKQWGYLYVLPEGETKPKEYSMLDLSCTMVKIPSPQEERADKLLFMENHGITDSWID